MAANKLERELKRGSAELLILALLEERQRHGYDIGQLIASRSKGAIYFHITSLYPTLYRLEDGGFIEGRWVERAGQRRRRYLMTADRTPDPPRPRRCSDPRLGDYVSRARLNPARTVSTASACPSVALVPPTHIPHATRTRSPRHRGTWLVAP
jgi:PadR family transcriptional regulator